MITLLATIVVLGVLIFVHELGHFVTAKLVDIEVPRFSIGLGPKAFGFKRGETEYVVSWLPLGGYVKMAGMEEMEAIEGGPSKKPVITGAGTAEDLGLEVETRREAGPRDFESKSLPARALVISAGVIMNILFAIVVFSLIAMVWGVRGTPDTRVGGVAEEYLPRGTEALATIPTGTRITQVGRESVSDLQDLQVALSQAGAGPIEFRFDNFAPLTIELPASQDARDTLISAFEPAVDTPPVVGTIVQGSPADQGGLRPGDRVISAGGQNVQSWQQFVQLIERHGGQALQLQVQRDGKPITITVTPEARKLANNMTYGRVGIAPEVSVADALPRVRAGFFGGIAHGATQTWDMVALTAGFLWDLVTGGASARNLGGPILIGQLSGRVARAGLEPFLAFMALFSVNLAVLNLLPIPVLDGGHLVFLGVEAVRGRPLSIESRMRWSQVGFVIVIAIMVWALANDVLRLFGV
ncbi:MAG TPA: RIP metalloprotease RseP [Longimicrobiales bacterium]